MRDCYDVNHFSRLQRFASVLLREKGVLLSGKAVLFWQKDDWF